MENVHVCQSQDSMDCDLRFGLLQSAAAGIRRLHPNRRESAGLEQPYSICSVC